MKRLGIVRPETTDSESINRIEELIDLDSYRTELEGTLSRLSVREREEALRLRVVDDLPFTEVATALGCSEGAARVRVHRALGRLANWMEAPS